VNLSVPTSMQFYPERSQDSDRFAATN